MSWTYDHTVRGYGSEEKTLYAPALMVGTDQYGLITSHSDSQIIYTMDADVCAGVAVFNQGGPTAAGVMHILSDGAFEARGENAIKEHAQRCWDMLAQNIDPHTSFSAILFGGKAETDKNAGPATKVSGWLADGLRRAVENSSNVAIVRDFQRQDGPHDVILDSSLRRVYVQSAMAKPITIETPRELLRSGLPVQKFTP